MLREGPQPGTHSDSGLPGEPSRTHGLERFIQGKAMLNSENGGRKLTVSLGHIQLPVHIEAQTAPRLDKTAYLVAYGELPEGVWPSGEVTTLSQRRLCRHLGLRCDAQQQQTRTPLRA